ncbi:MAG: hypothetical protein IPK97_19860 [Ahniella sp.]|nr:hypothetical protein [Ahniella sp.]
MRQGTVLPEGTIGRLAFTSLDQRGDRGIGDERFVVRRNGAIMPGGLQGFDDRGSGFRQRGGVQILEGRIGQCAQHPNRVGPCILVVRPQFQRIAVTRERRFTLPIQLKLGAAAVRNLAADACQCRIQRRL